MMKEVKAALDDQMKKTLASLQTQLSKVRTGRASTNVLDGITVDYYGTPTHISQVANITLLDARTIGVQPWEKNMGAKIEKAIRESDLGVNPAQLIAAGRSSYTPLVANDSPENRAKNRRTEIILTPKLDELLSILSSQ